MCNLRKSVLITSCKTIFHLAWRLFLDKLSFLYSSVSVNQKGYALFEALKSVARLNKFLLLIAVVNRWDFTRKNIVLI